MAESKSSDGNSFPTGSTDWKVVALLKHYDPAGDILSQSSTADVSQQEFLRYAMQRLGLSRPAMARRIGVSSKAINNWMNPSDGAIHRSMPLIAWKFIAEILLGSSKGTPHAKSK